MSAIYPRKPAQTEQHVCSCGKTEYMAGVRGCTVCRGVATGEPIIEAEPQKQPAEPKRNGGRMERIKRVCACGFETDWPPAWGRHLKDKDPAKHYDVAKAPTEDAEPFAHEHYCSDIDECRSDLSCTPCGADPCELVAAEAEAAHALTLEDVVQAAHNEGMTVEVRLEPRRDIRLELILAKLDLAILRVQELRLYDETEAILEDLDRAHALVKEL